MHSVFWENGNNCCSLSLYTGLFHQVRVQYQNTALEKYVDGDEALASPGPQA